MVADSRNRPPHSHAASEKLNSVVRVAQTGPPALFAFPLPSLAHTSWQNRCSNPDAATKVSSLSIISQTLQPSEFVIFVVTEYREFVWYSEFPWQIISGLPVIQEQSG